MALPSSKLLNPASVSENSLEAGFDRALHLFHEAAARIPAYSDFLKSAHVRAETIQTAEDFKNVPTTDKTNYFSRYSLEELSWDGTLERAKYVSASSGTTGVPFFWPRGHEQDEIIGNIQLNLYESAFGAAQGTTLFVNSFSLGTWIAGMEFFNAVRWVSERGLHTTLVTPGIDKFEAIRQIQKLAPLYDRVILAGYPPFVKDILDQGVAAGVAWGDIDLKLLFGGEAIVEPWRDRVLRLMDSDGSPARIINIFGMAEAGVVAHETPVSIFARRNLAALAPHNIFPDAETVMGVYQFYPAARYFETEQDGSLLLTANAGLPLIRYSTRDMGGIIEHDALASKLSTLPGAENVPLDSWRLPFVFLHGRKDLSLSLYAVNVYTENVKLGFELSPHTNELSGMFTMSVGHDENLDQRFDISVELAEGITNPGGELAALLSQDLVDALRKVNSEYAKLYSVVGERARPHVTLVAHGTLGAVPGRKHRWVRRG